MTAISESSSLRIRNCLLITPHVSGGFSLPETLEKIVGLFADNLERYFAGQPIENLVNLQTGYRE